MPLVYQQDINQFTRLGLWEIRETEEWLRQGLTPGREIKHAHKRLQHLAGRKLLSILAPQLDLNEIRYNEAGKPATPKGDWHFSVSHGGNYAAAIVSRNYRSGIDVEPFRESIIQIAARFLSADESLLIDAWQLGPVEANTLAWSMKESLFKYASRQGIDFKKHLQIRKVQKEGEMYSAQCLISKGFTQTVEVTGFFFPGLAMSWVFGPANI